MADDAKKEDKEKGKKVLDSEESEKPKDSLEEKLLEGEQEEELEDIVDEGEELPFEMAEGITDTLEQVDIKDVLQHSGEGEQKTRAHLEEELAWESWKPREESSEGGVTYGMIKKDSVAGNYIDNRAANGSGSVGSAYETTNDVYGTSDGQSNLYDVDNERIEESDVGQIRRTRNSDLEIQGLSKKNDMRAGGTMGGHRGNENYK